MDSALKEQVMINQFVMAAGCSRDQAAAILTQAGWQFQTALSIYFQEASIPCKNTAGFSLITPANTPATPPNFPDALNMFSSLSTSDKMATSPLAPSTLSPRIRNSFSPNSNTMSPPPPPQFNQQSGFIQSNQPIRGQAGNPPFFNQQCDQQSQSGQQVTSLAEGGDSNFMTMEMEGVPQ